MIIFYKDGKQTSTCDDLKNAWINLVAPSMEEVAEISQLHIAEDDIRAAIDPEEKTRIEHHHNYTLIIVDIPTDNVRYEKASRETIPLGIIITKENLITICSRETSILNYFYDEDLKKFNPSDRFKFFCLIMLRISALYQEVLIEVNKKRIEFEEHISSTIKEDKLVKLHNLESTLVYFITSLGGNNNILHKLMRMEGVFQHGHDHELLNDVIIENQQSMEMARIYREIIDSTRELISSILDLRMNHVMKQLTAITVIFSIPMVISGMYGMNLNPDGMPFAKFIHGFGAVSVIIVIVCIIMMILFKKKHMM